MENKELVFPLLRAKDIEVKVKQVNQKGAVLLLYKNARVDMNMLDKVVGVYNWTCSYREIKNVLYCQISIYDSEKNIWISKEDCGIESRADEEGNEKKGEASDSFKRAAFRFSIGRELYTAPFIFAKVDTVERNGKWFLTKFLTFSVSHITYDNERNIKDLTIIDNNGNVVFTTGKQASRKKTEGDTSEKVVKPIVENEGERLAKIDNVVVFYNSLDEEKMTKFREWFMKKYNKPMGVMSGVGAMTIAQLDDVLSNIEKMK